MAGKESEQHSRDEFLDHVRVMVEYWDGTLSSSPQDTLSRRDRLEGLAHSILTAIDQRGFVLIPEDSKCATEEVLGSAISGVLNDDLFNKGIWKKG